MASTPSPTSLIEECQGLVRLLASRIHRKLPSHVELGDLEAYGQVGLLEAARDFDPTRGGRFSTFAYYRIRGAIYDGLAKMSWFSRTEYRRRRRAFWPATCPAGMPTKTGPASRRWPTPQRRRPRLPRSSARPIKDFTS